MEGPYNIRFVKGRTEVAKKRMKKLREDPPKKAPRQLVRPRLGRAPAAPKKGAFKQVKTCRTCGKAYPATLEYFRRNHPSQDGLLDECKWCASDFIKAHYVQFTREELEQAGKVGALCPLWTRRCGTCDEKETCWRLRGNAPKDLPWDMKPAKDENGDDNDPADDK